MEEEATSRPRMKQLLWIGAGVAVLTALVLAGSWLFSPRAPDRSAVTPAAGLKEEEVQKQTFQPETAQPRPEVAPEPLPEPETVTPEQAPPSPGAQEAAGGAPPEAPAEKEARSAQEEPLPSSVSGAFGVQVGAFSSQANARDVIRRLQAAGFKSSVLEKGGKFKVVVGGFGDRASAEKTLAEMRRSGFASAFIVPLEGP